VTLFVALLPILMVWSVSTFLLSALDGLEIPTPVATAVSHTNSDAFHVHFTTHHTVFTGILAISFTRLLSVHAL
jgi:hypothetical protein